MPGVPIWHTAVRIDTFFVGQRRILGLVFPPFLASKRHISDTIGIAAIGSTAASGLR
jgi:hypothetical protein